MTVRTAVLLAILAGCGSREPALTAQKSALDAWRRGQTALTAGDPKGAAAAFDEALGFQPDDPLLLAWKAKALADQGDLDAAIAVMDRVLAANPGLVEARYNRAAWLARLGKPDDAAVDLELALAGGLEKLPRDVLDDPDFAPYLDHPAFAKIIPHAALTVGVDKPEGAVFFGSEFDLRYRVLGAADAVVAFQFDALTGPFALVEAFEDSSPSTDGPLRDLTFRFRATGAGDVTIGPATVTAGRRSGRVELVTVPAKAPPGRESATEPAPKALLTPREALAGHPIPAAWRDGDALFVAAAAADVVRIAPDANTLPVRYEIRDASAPQSVILRWETVPAGTHVTVSHVASVVLDATP